jgi:hypothetical protein
LSIVWAWVRAAMARKRRNQRTRSGR